MKYTVRKLAAAAGVTVRTLHHYDVIGLLKPQRGDNNYRYYGSRELLRLQQILLYRELEVPLETIAEILDKPGFDFLKALSRHREYLLNEQARINTLVKTVNKTINTIRKGGTMSANDMYGGLTKKQMEEYRAEAESRWGNTEAYRQSVKRIKAMGKAGLKKVGEEGLSIEKAFAELLGSDVHSKQVQDIVVRHRAHIAQFYDVSDEIYRGLAHMYIEDPRFTAHYDRLKPGLAQFVSDAILASLDR